MKTFYSLLSLCLIVPTLLFSENSYEKHCREHREAAATRIKNHDQLIKEADRCDFQLVDERLDKYHRALAEVILSKQNLEQILRILSQSEAKKNLKAKIEDIRIDAEITLKRCEQLAVLLNNNIFHLSNAQKEARELLPKLQLKKIPSRKEPAHIPLSLDATLQREKKRRDLFYFTSKSDHTFYTQQFYQTTVQSDSPELTVKVYEQEKLLYEENISLPSPSGQGWDLHLKEDGLLYIPKTFLSKEYGLDLRIGYISENQYLIAQKAVYPNYSFQVFSGEKLLYALHFLEPPPWQLGMLKKPALSSFLEPLSKQSIALSAPTVPCSNDKKHPVLVQFVQDMGKDPISLAQYVQNEIELDLIGLKNNGGIFIEPLYKRSPLMTFLEGQGSPSDQCAFLLHLLEIAGYNAVLIPPTFCVSLPSHLVRKLLLTDLPDGQEIQLAFPGVLVHDGDQQIVLYPWIKEIRVEEGYDLYSVLPDPFASPDRWIKDYLTGNASDGKDDTAAVLFLQFLEEELKKQQLSIKDVGIHRTICKKQFNSWEDFPRPSKQAENQEGFPLNQPSLMQITVGSCENPYKRRSISLPLPNLNEGIMELSFSPSEFRLQMEDVQGKSLVLPLDAYDSTLSLTVCFNDKPLKAFSFTRGTRTALCFHTGRVTTKHLELFQKAYETEKDETKRLHHLLSFMGMAYFEKCSRAEQILAALHKIPPITCFAVGLAKLSPDLSTGELVFPQVDMQFYTTYLDEPTPLKTVLGGQLQNHLAINNSSNEHQILRDLFQDSHPVSTVKLLENAHREDRGILALTKESFSQLDKIPFLQLRALSKGQWAILKEVFEDPKSSPLSYAYMTPELISNGRNPPSYRGIGTLIFNPRFSAALISDHDHFIHGGYGSPLPPNFLVDTKLSPYKNGFTLFKISNDLLSLPKLTPTNQQVTEQIQKTWLTADVRPGHKLGTNLVSDPVDVVTGAFYVDEVDLTLPGPFPLQIRRNYSNQSPLPGLFGFGWKLGLNPYLHEEDDKLFAAEMDGTVIVYRLNGDCYEVFAEDNPELRNFGGTANPFHAYIKDNILYGADGSSRIFKDRLLRQWIDPVGNILSFDYDGEQLVKIENSIDSFVRFHYNPEGKISEAFTKDGRWVKYHYTYQGDLDQVTLPNGAIIAYAYDGHHQITQESRPCGRVLENKYNTKGQVIEQCSPVGLQQQIVPSATFKFEDGMTTVIDGEGGTTQYLIYDKQIYKITDPVGQTTYQSWFIDERSYFDAIGGKVLLWEGNGAYSNSLKTTQDKRGLITEYRYDACGNPNSFIFLDIEKRLKYNEHHLCVKESTLNRTTRTFYHEYLPVKIEKWVDDQLTSTTHFTYDEKGHLIQQNVDGAVSRWTYESGLPIQMIQETGTEDPDVVTTFKYNRQGQCIEKVSSDGIERHEYDIMGNNLVTSLYNRFGQLLSTTYFGYNQNNQMIWKQGPNPENTLFIDYNAAGQVMASRQALTEGYAYTLYEYDTRGELIEEVNPLGVSICRKLDEIGRPISVTKAGLTTQYIYEPGGFVASTLSPMGAKITRNYTTNGLLEKEVYPDGTESTFVYDPFGRPTQEVRNGTITNIFYDDLHQKIVRTTANITETQTFDTRGLLIASTDGEGSTWKKTYDGLGRVKTEISPDGQQTTWNYNGDTIICHLPSGEKTVQQFECGQLIKSETFNLNGDLIASTKIIYDHERNLKQEISGHQTISTWFNTLGQPLKVEDRLTTILYRYDPSGQCIATTDGEGRTTHFQFDPHGRLTKKTLPDHTSIGYTYDDDSHLVSYDLPENLSWKASYDQMGRKTSEQLQSGFEVSQQWQYIYENGLLQRAIDPMGRAHIYSYDALSRLERETINDFTRSFAYDNRGLITSAENNDSKVLRSYDTCGRLISESTYLDSTLIQQTNQSWSPTNRILIVNGHQREFSYESGRLKTVSSQGQTLRYDYDLSGNLVKKATPFATVDIHYNASLPESIITHLQDHTHTESLKWSPSGKLSSHNTKNFSYTPQGFLSQAGEEHFSFNPLGIRNSANHTSIPHDGIDAFGKIIAELIDSKPVKTTYNALGQTTSQNDTSFEWDPWGNLIKVTTPNSTWKASYDSFGRRLKTTHTAGWWPFPIHTLSYYDPQHEFQEIGLQSGSNTFWKIYGPNSCEFILDDKGNSVGLLNDAVGNLIAVLTSKNTSWTKELPSAYGPLTAPPTTSSLLTYAHSLTWQGKQQDPTGLIHFGARYYDPTRGRFLSPDPIAYPIPLNLYSYANGDPINFRDPSGRFASTIYETTQRFVADSFLPLPVSHVYNHMIQSCNALSAYCANNGFTRSSQFQVGSFDLPNGSIDFINGINNTETESLATVTQLSKYAQGAKVHGTYNRSNTVPVDILECMVQHMGFHTPPVQLIKNRWNHLIAKHGPDAKFLQFCHSGGADQIKNALLSSPESVRKQIIVVALAPSVIIPNELCFQSYNYVSRNDFVTYLDIMGQLNHGDELMVLDPHPSADWWDHGISSPTFEVPLRRRINEYIKDYGGKK